MTHVFNDMFKCGFIIFISADQTHAAQIIISVIETFIYI